MLKYWLIQYRKHRLGKLILKLDTENSISVMTSSLLKKHSKAEVAELLGKPAFKLAWQAAGFR